MPIVMTLAFAAIPAFKLLDDKEEEEYNGISAGVALAPTSVGIGLTLLMQAKQLDKDYGQTIIAAAFLVLLK